MRLPIGPARSSDYQDVERLSRSQALVGDAVRHYLRSGSSISYLREAFVPLSIGFATYLQERPVSRGGLTTLGVGMSAVFRAMPKLNRTRHYQV